MYMYDVLTVSPPGTLHPQRNIKLLTFAAPPTTSTHPQKGRNAQQPPQATLARLRRPRRQWQRRPSLHRPQHSTPQSRRTPGAHVARRRPHVWQRELGAAATPPRPLRCIYISCEYAIAPIPATTASMIMGLPPLDSALSRAASLAAAISSALSLSLPMRRPSS